MLASRAAAVALLGSGSGLPVVFAVERRLTDPGLRVMVYALAGWDWAC